MIVDNSAQIGALYVGYFPTVFMAYLNICMNPFIYATKHDGVKEKLRSLMVWNKCRRHAAVADDLAGGSATGGTQQTPAGVTRLSLK